MLSAEDVEPVLSEVVKERFVIIRIEFHGDRSGILLITNSGIERTRISPVSRTFAAYRARRIPPQSETYHRAVCSSIRLPRVIPFLDIAP